MRFHAVPAKSRRWLNWWGYLFLAVAVHIPIHLNVNENHHPLLFTIVIVAIVACCDVLTTQNPEYTAFFFANRGVVTGVVVVLSFSLGSILIWRANELASIGHRFVELIQFTLQGALTGVVIRILVLAMFAQLLRGKDIEMPRLLLLAAFAVLLWLFPLGASHRIHAGPYVYGIGLGFAVHYLVRRKEHQRAEAARLGRYIMELLASNSLLPATEDQVVRLFASQKWHALDRLLTAQEHNPTTLRAIVQASRLRIQGKYADARAIVEEELERKEHDVRLETFLHLHRALSLADLNLKDEMNKALDHALDCHGDCLLSRVTKGLRMAEEIPFGSETQSETAQQALHHIWAAMKINDESEPQLAARIVGRAVPVTWTFLLDSYAYVLLKAGHVRFSRALLTECIYEDPYFSSPYLHLGEWCIADLLRSRRGGANESISERSQRVGRLSLNIAIKLEGKRHSLTKRRAEGLLIEYASVLHAK